MSETRAELVPPDGGWGWIIIGAYSLSMICTVPILQNFGLIFRNTCYDLKMSTTDVTLIVNLNLAVGNCFSLVNAPLLKRFGYRKIAVAGSLLFSIAVTVTAWANSFAFFICSYSILGGISSGMSFSAFSLALNSYFNENRNRATGFGATLMGLGMILIPQLISFLMTEYGVTGTVLILGGLSGNGLIAAVLLQPIAWHMKRRDEPDRRENSAALRKTDDEDELRAVDDYADERISENDSHETREIENVTKHGAETRSFIEDKRMRSFEKGEDGDEEEEEERDPEKAPLMKQLLRSVVFYFDLDLLRDPIYVNMILGLSIAAFAESNFLLLLPFIMNEMGLDTRRTATVMSTFAVVDLISRSAAAFIGEWLKQPPRVMYTLSIGLLIAIRSLFVFADSYELVLMAAACFGAARGIRNVYMYLCLPNYVPIEKLAAASGIQMMTNGILFVSLGSVLGTIRDKSGGYDLCILFLNLTSGLMIAMWLIEAVVVRRKKKRASSVENCA